VNFSIYDKETGPIKSEILFLIIFIVVYLVYGIAVPLASQYRHLTLRVR